MNKLHKLFIRIQYSIHYFFYCLRVWLFPAHGKIAKNQFPKKSMIIWIKLNSGHKVQCYFDFSEYRFKVMKYKLDHKTRRYDNELKIKTISPQHIISWKEVRLNKARIGGSK